MKRFIFFSLLLMLAVDASAQLSYGFKGGVNYSSVSDYDKINISQTLENVFNEETPYRLGYYAGVFSNYAMSNGILAFQPELMYSHQEVKSDGRYQVGGYTGSYSSTLKMDYINFPVLVQVYVLPKVLCVEAGPQAGFLLGAKSSDEIKIGGTSLSDDSDVKEDLNSVDFSLVVGFGFQLPGLPIGINARYSFGLANVVKDLDDDYSTHNNVLQAGIFVKF